MVLSLIGFVTFLHQLKLVINMTFKKFMKDMKTQPTFFKQIREFVVIQNYLMLSGVFGIETHLV